MQGMLNYCEWEPPGKTCFFISSIMLADKVISSSFSSLTTTTSPINDQPDFAGFTSTTRPMKGPLGSGCQTWPPVFLGRLGTHTRSPAAKLLCIDYPDGSRTTARALGLSLPSSSNYGPGGFFGLRTRRCLDNGQVIAVLARGSSIGPQDLYHPLAFKVK